jgi:hypothetical protein
MLELTWKAIDEKTIQASLNIDAAKLFLFPLPLRPQRLERFFNYSDATGFDTIQKKQLQLSQKCDRFWQFSQCEMLFTIRYLADLGELQLQILSPVQE